ncbi:MAG TPA: alpha/beta fold hydrolase [Dehalococcoidia bacterium]|nr:alpha/beta fold hydrolase [Dehalococcoidia bacterium]
MYPSIILVHGAATGAWIWDAWRRHLQPFGWDVNVLDLRGHGRSLPADLGAVTMEDYLADLESVAGQIAVFKGAHPIVGGWGMGGLLALMYAATHPETPALLLFSPDQPLEIAGKASIEELRRHPGAVLTPEAFGVFADDFERSRMSLSLSEDETKRFVAESAGAEESGLAYRQRLRGISVPAGAVICPSLVIYGAHEGGGAPANQVALAHHLLGDQLAMQDAGHWGVICSDTTVSQAAPEVDAWLRSTLPS